MKPVVWLEVLLALLINGNGSIASFSGLERGQATLGMTPANEEWRLANGPRKNMTSQWIFDTTASLLQKWPNTRLRNGHTLVPGLIPTGTLLYHGTTKNEIPQTPEWASLDPEFSRGFCRKERLGDGCWHLTMVATRPLKMLYFDGSSAAKMWGGSLDSQDVLIWGGVQLNRTWDEDSRIKDLCNWGKVYGIDAFLRMSMDFEVMVCSFSAGLQTVSFLNLEPVSVSFSPVIRVLEAGSWQDNFPGESRVQLDYSRLLSFYDTTLFPNLQTLRFDKSRWDHNLADITPNEINSLHSALETTLTGDWGRAASGVEWKALFHVVKDRYANRLEVLRYILNGTLATRTKGAEAILKIAQRHTTAMMSPYILHSLYPHHQHLGSSNHSDWAAPVVEECATTHTRHIERDNGLSAKLTRSERLLLGAVKDVSSEICRVVVSLWAEGVERDLMEDCDDDTCYQSSDKSNKDLLDSWKQRVSGLMDWLDWSHWVRCQPACEYEEMCYLPTWPFFNKWPAGPTPHDPNRTIANFAMLTVSEEPGPDDDWYHPKPRCIRYIEPFEPFGG